MVARWVSGQLGMACTKLVYTYIGEYVYISKCTYMFCVFVDLLRCTKFSIRFNAFYMVFNFFVILFSCIGEAERSSILKNRKRK